MFGINIKNKTMKALTLFLTLLMFLTSCDKKDDDQSCDDGNSTYQIEFNLMHQTNDVAISALDEDSDDDCVDFDFLITVAPLNGSSSPQEIAQALNNNYIYSQRIAIEEEGVKQHSVNLSDLNEFDNLGNLMIYATLVLKLPIEMTPNEYRSSSTFNPDSFKMFYFGVYEGGDAPDISPCNNCENGVCDNGTPISCGCHGGFCLCTLCIEEVIFE